MGEVTKKNNGGKRSVRKEASDLMADALPAAAKFFAKQLERGELDKDQLSLIKLQQDAAKIIVEYGLGKPAQNAPLKPKNTSIVLNLVMPESGDLKAQAQNINGRKKKHERPSPEGTGDRGVHLEELQQDGENPVQPILGWDSIPDRAGEADHYSGPA